MNESTRAPGGGLLAQSYLIHTDRTACWSRLLQHQSQSVSSGFNGLVVVRWIATYLLTSSVRYFKSHTQEVTQVKNHPVFML